MKWVKGPMSVETGQTQVDQNKQKLASPVKFPKPGSFFLPPALCSLFTSLQLIEKCTKENNQCDWI